jgi:very-short-patch-repair endonuclease
MHAVERAIGAIAGAQDNVIHRDQLMAAGLGRGAIRHRLSAGRLQPLHRAVYLIGHAPPTEIGRARAAVLACGDGAVASHRTAAVLWDLLRATTGDVDVMITGRHPHSRPGIAVHRTLELPASEVRDIRGLAITSPARTVCDIAGTEPTNDVEHALQEARVRKLLTDPQLQAIVAQAPTRKGAALIKKLLAIDGATGYTRSKAERRMRSLLRQANVRMPRSNVYMHGCLVDFVWEDERIVVEVDGYLAHGNRSAFEVDRKRDQILAAVGYTVIRITWRQLTEEPLEVVARLAQALGSHS